MEVADWFEEIELLVMEGDAAALAAKVSAFVGVAEPAETGPGAPGAVSGDTSN